jgi:DNA ligase (NAD+)
MANLSRASKEDLERIFEIGPAVAESIYRFFSQDENRLVIEKLAQAKVNQEITEAARKSDRFQGKQFVLTGKLPGMTREEAAQLIESHGGKITATVTKKTDFVLAGEEPGSKLDKAKKLGINIMDEIAFRKMLEAP